jgi:TRAP-type C4-dicarboxylate transport system substrate-binding protein
MMHSRILAVAAIAAAVCATSTVQAQVPKDEKITVVGLPSMVNGWKFVQQPSFSKHIPDASNGRITFDAKPHDLAGIDLKEATRLTADGVYHVSFGAFAIHAGDDPRLEGIDLPGIGLTVEQARTAVNSYRTVVEKALADKFKVKLLSVHPNTMQALFCRPGVRTINDLKGKKVRVFGTAMADYVKALGAVTVNIPFPEVLPALQQGVADCGITSPANGNGARWWEVTRELIIMPIGGWGLGFFVANTDWWNKLPKPTQDFLTAEFRKIEDRHWEQAAIDLKVGITCNTGEGECQFGVKAEEGKRMRVNYPSDADMKRHVEIMQSAVLTGWAKRCGADCAKQWNETIGKSVGMTAPVN